MTSILASSPSSTLQPAVAGGEPSPLQGHDQAVMAALQALGRANAGVLMLAASGARTTEANQSWRVALLEDLATTADQLAVEINALVAAELDGRG